MKQKSSCHAHVAALIPEVTNVDTPKYAHICVIMAAAQNQIRADDDMTELHIWAYKEHGLIDTD